MLVYWLQSICVAVLPEGAVKQRQKESSKHLGEPTNEASQSEIRISYYSDKKYIHTEI